MRIQTITIGEQTDDQIVAECLDSMIDRIQDAETNAIKANECPVCMEQFGEGNMVAETGDNCDHRVCWLDFQTLACSTNSCPICRATLRGGAVESDSGCEFDETSSDDTHSDTSEFDSILDGDARITPTQVLIVRVNDAWIQFGAISGINNPANQDLLGNFITARQALIQGNGNGGRNETGCRYCGIQENQMAHQYFLSMREHLIYCDMEIGADMNHLYYRDGVCPLCRFIDTHSCDTCHSYSPEIHLRYHECGIISDNGVSVCLTCEGEMEEEDPSLFIRCRDAGCALCENYQSDSD
jgi:hypothetical protein